MKIKKALCQTHHAAMCLTIEAIWKKVYPIKTST